MGSACEGSSYRHICPSRKRIQRMKSVFPHSCQKGLAIVWPYSRRRESAYILSYQSLFSVSINRASPEGDYPKCAKEGLAQTSFRGGIRSAISDRNSANLSLLISWQPSSSLIGKGVLSYQPPLKGGRVRASPDSYESSKCQLEYYRDAWHFMMKLRCFSTRHAKLFWSD